MGERNRLWNLGRDTGQDFRRKVWCSAGRAAGLASGLTSGQTSDQTSGQTSGLLSGQHTGQPSARYRALKTLLCLVLVVSGMCGVLALSGCRAAGQKQDTAQMDMPLWSDEFTEASGAEAGSGADSGAEAGKVASSRFTIDIAPLWRACARRCLQDDEYGILTRRGCVEGCQMAYATITDKGMTYGSADGCRRDIARMKTDERVKELRKQCTDRWKHLFKRRGCSDAVETYFSPWSERLCVPENMPIAPDEWSRMD